MEVIWIGVDICCTIKGLNVCQQKNEESLKHQPAKGGAHQARRNHTLMQTTQWCVFILFLCHPVKHTS